MRFYGDYCFTVANGDIPAESTMCANWCFQEGYTKVGFFWEKGSSGTDYSDYFRRAAEQVGVEIIKEVSLGPNPRDMECHLATMREQGARGDRLRGLRLLDVPLRPGLQGPRLGPAADQRHGVHVLFELERAGRGARGLARRGPARRGRPRTRTTRRCSSGSTPASVASPATSSWRWPTTPPGPASTASPTCLIATPDQVKNGLEMIKWMPCTNGGPGTYITFARDDHRGYKGDFLTIRELRGVAGSPRLLPADVAVEPVVAAPRAPVDHDRRSRRAAEWACGALGPGR